MATTRLEERLLASLGKLQVASIRFEAVADVPKGGVLCALPALLALGLLRHSQEKFSLPAGYYPLETIFLAVSFLALARVASLEELRYEPPGEWGKLLGLDRIPEVRTLPPKSTVKGNSPFGKPKGAVLMGDVGELPNGLDRAGFVVGCLE